jgi:hypothetical protein
MFESYPASQLWIRRNSVQSRLLKNPEVGACHPGIASAGQAMVYASTNDAKLQTIDCVRA